MDRRLGPGPATRGGVGGTAQSLWALQAPPFGWEPLASSSGACLSHPGLQRESCPERPRDQGVSVQGWGLKA